jgi:hypothetical protein
MVVPEIHGALVWHKNLRFGASEFVQVTKARLSQSLTPHTHCGWMLQIGDTSSESCSLAFV